uniref:Uncharacterized protein n=1 Tax=Chenopodium quinoa TaxID=63459 RepID=A0A803N3G4_CHEQI
YLNASVKKRSNWFNKSQEKTDEIDEESPLFLKAGYPLGRKKKGKKKGKAYTLYSATMALAHRYVLFNCQDDQVENYIKEHEEFVKKSRDKRKRRWKEAQEHSNEFMVLFREKVVVDNFPDHIKWLYKGPSPIVRRYTRYFCNRYKFYTRDHDERCKTQNNGVSLTALTPSFASSKDHNPVLEVIIPATTDHDEHQSWCKEAAYDRVMVPVNNEMREHNHEDSSDIDDTDYDWMEPSK